MATSPRLADRLVGWILRAESTRREIVLAALFLFVLLGAGMIGYRLIEGWRWLDGLYMTFITISTIGFAEVHPLTPTGRLFTIGIAFVGIGSVAFIATRSAQLLLTGETLKTRHMQNQIANLSGHYILCGYGRIGSRIAQDLRRADVPFVVIDAAPEKVESALAHGALALLGDAQADDILRQAGIQTSRGLILTLPKDSANVFVTLTAREHNPSIFILVRTDTSVNRRKLLRAGADKVVAPYEIGADRMAQVLLRPHVDQFMEEILQTDGIDLNVGEVAVEEHSRIAGKTLATSNLRRSYDAMVVAIISGESGEMHFNPSAETTLNSGDILIVMGSVGMIEQLRLETRESA